MISVPVRSADGSEVGTYEFDPARLASGINKQLLHDAVVMYEARRRVGTVQTKSRGMVAGSTKKLYRQKGTGRARAGARRTPVRRGGGHAFGKTPVDYSYRMPRKAVRLATRMALLSKFQDGEAIVLDSLQLDTPRTRTVVDMLRALGVTGSCLLSTAGCDLVLWKSARNIPEISVLPAVDFNAYALLRHRQLVVTREAMDAVLAQASSGAAEQE